MSAYTTLHITRAKAVEVVLSLLLENLPDEELVRMVDGVLEPRLYNVRIVTPDAQNDDHLL